MGLFIPKALQTQRTYQLYLFSLISNQTFTLLYNYEWGEQTLVCILQIKRALRHGSETNSFCFKFILSVLTGFILELKYYIYIYKHSYYNWCYLPVPFSLLFPFLSITPETNPFGVCVFQGARSSDLTEKKTRGETPCVPPSVSVSPRPSEEVQCVIVNVKNKD